MGERREKAACQLVPAVCRQVLRALSICLSVEQRYLDVRFVVPDFHKARVEAAELVDFLLVLVSHLLEGRRRRHSKQAGREWQKVKK